MDDNSRETLRLDIENIHSDPEVALSLTRLFPRILEVQKNSLYEAAACLINELIVALSLKYASLWLFNQQENNLELVATSAPLELVNSINLGLNTPAGCAITNQDGFFFEPDVSHSSTYRDKELIAHFDLRELYACVVGVSAPIAVACLYPNRTLNKNETELVKSACRVMAIPLSLSSDVQKINTVQKLGALPRPRLDKKSFAHKAARAIAELLNAECASIYEWSNGAQAYQLVNSYSQGSKRTIQLLNNEDILLMNSENPFSVKMETWTGSEDGDTHPTAYLRVKHPVISEKSIGLIRVERPYSPVRKKDIRYFSPRDHDAMLECARAIANGLYYYSEKNRLKGIFGSFLHEAELPIEGIQAKCEQLIHRNRFPTAIYSLDRSLADIWRYAEVLSTIALQYNAIGHNEYKVTIPTSSVHFETTILMPCIRVAVTDLHRYRVPTRTEKGSYTIEYDAGDFRDLRMRIDEVRVRQVLGNLLRNAVKYRNEDKKIFRTKIVGKIIDNAFIIAVADTGIGVGAHERERIFELEYRSRLAESRDPHGQGLGLYLARQYMKAHGGKIYLLDDSEFGLWEFGSDFNSVFCIEFPRKLTNK